MWLTFTINTIVVAAMAIVSRWLAVTGIDTGNDVMMVFSNWTAGIGLGWTICWTWMSIRQYFEDY